MFPYTATIYFHLLERYTAALWPLPVVAGVLAVAALLLALRPLPGSGRAVATLLAGAWLGVGGGFYLNHAVPLSYLAPPQGGLFLLQGLLLLWHGTVRNRLPFQYRGTAPHRAGLALAVAALVAYPLLDGLADSAWLGLRLAGLAPAPTMLFTTGLLMLARPPRHLLVLPFLWSLFAGFSAWRLAVPTDAALPVLALLALVLGLRRAQGSKDSQRR